jgi:hypothetical protein
MEYNKPKLIEVETKNGLPAFFYNDEYVKHLEDKLKEAVNYKHCSLQLKEKEDQAFNRYVQENGYTKMTNEIIYLDKNWTKISKKDLFKQYQELTKPLIV